MAGAMQRPQAPHVLATAALLAAVVVCCAAVASAAPAGPGLAQCIIADGTAKPSEGCAGVHDVAPGDPARLAAQAAAEAKAAAAGATGSDAGVPRKLDEHEAGPQTARAHVEDLVRVASQLLDALPQEHPLRSGGAVSADGAVDKRVAAAQAAVEDMILTYDWLLAQKDGHDQELDLLQDQLAHFIECCDDTVTAAKLRAASEAGVDPSSVLPEAIQRAAGGKVNRGEVSLRQLASQPRLFAVEGLIDTSPEAGHVQRLLSVGEEAMHNAAVAAAGGSADGAMLPDAVPGVSSAELSADAVANDPVLFALVSQVHDLVMMPANNSLPLSITRIGRGNGVELRAAQAKLGDGGPAVPRLLADGSGVGGYATLMVVVSGPEDANGGHFVFPLAKRVRDGSGASGGGGGAAAATAGTSTAARKLKRAELQATLEDAPEAPFPPLGPFCDEDAGLLRIPPEPGLALLLYHAHPSLAADPRATFGVCEVEASAEHAEASLWVLEYTFTLEPAS